jgi:hypothetical protein
MADSAPRTKSHAGAATRPTSEPTGRRDVRARGRRAALHRHDRPIPDGRVREIFLHNHKPNSGADTNALDSAIVCSLALQCGADIETIRKVLCRDSQSHPSGSLGAVLDSSQSGGARGMSMATADNRVSHQDTFEEACRRADEKRRREAEPARLAQMPRLLHDNVSLEPAWYERNRGDGAPPASVEALVHELRTHGLAALERPNCLRRLSDVSTAQLRDVIARLIRLRSRYASITDDLLLKVGGQL